jgi:hypothetical protein
VCGFVGCCQWRLCTGLHGCLTHTVVACMPLPGDVVYEDPTVPRGPWKDFDPEDDWVNTELWVRYTDEWKGL